MAEATRTVVISGASSGIGAATARLLAAAGWTVVGIARGKDALSRLEEELASTSGRVITHSVDASSAEAVKRFAEGFLSEHGAPDAIVHCAGAGRWRYLEETTDDEAATMIGAPFLAAWNLNRSLLGAMVEAGRGVLIHVGSPVAFHPWPGCTGYAASRWALRGMHEALSQDLRGTGVKSCHVIFGEVSSPYFENNPGSREYLPGVAKLVRVIPPEEAAEVIVRVMRRPRTQLLYPASLKAMYLAAELAPGPVRWLAAATGRKR